MTSSTHTRKKQYQPSIASYFDRQVPTTSPTTNGSRSAPLTLPLPPEVQSSLINVGMRVRKSVPEGYKTHKTMGKDAFPFPSSAPVLQVVSSAPRRSGRAAANERATRELTPFCGLHKVGGFSSHASSSAPAMIESGDEEGDDDLPGLTMSQSTLFSTQDSVHSAGMPALSGGVKRTFEEDIEDDMDDYFAQIDQAETAFTTRPLAKPNTAFRRLGAGAMNGSDFEDAAFLAPVDDGMDVDDMGEF